MITLERLKELKRGDVICMPPSDAVTTRSNRVIRWRVNGKVQTWKRDASRVRVPVKHGLYAYAQITEQKLDDLNYMNAYIEGDNA